MIWTPNIRTCAADQNVVFLSTLMHLLLFECPSTLWIDGDRHPVLWIPCLNSSHNQCMSEPSYPSSLHLPCGFSSLVCYVLKKMPSSTSLGGGGVGAEGQSSLSSLLRSLRKPETLVWHAQTHARPYHNNPTEFLIIYSVISMSPVTSRDVRNSEACGTSALAFLVWLLLIWKKSFNQLGKKKAKSRAWRKGKAWWKLLQQLNPLLLP